LHGGNPEPFMAPTKTRPLITVGFSGAKIRCRLIPMKYAYARVSTDGQSIDAQVRQLKAAAKAAMPTPSTFVCVG
jgi:hypothetical protein